MRVLVLGAGGPASNGFARCLEMAGGYELVGANCDPLDLELAEMGERHLLPRGDSPRYRVHLLRLVKQTEPELIHAQSDEEVWALTDASYLAEIGSRVFLPAKETIRTCQDKWLSYCAWRDAGVPVPDTELPGYYERFRGRKLHLRPRRGAGGRGSVQGAWGFIRPHLPAFEGWSAYTLAEYIPGPTVAWQALYADGDLVVGQLRARLAWTEGHRGSARISETVDDPEAWSIAEAAVRAIDPEPRGIFGVDMTRDDMGHPRVTEINIGRFFTTIEFFARAGVNFPDLYCRLAVGRQVSPVEGLPPGLRWIRSMDRPAVLTTPGES